MKWKPVESELPRPGRIVLAYVPTRRMSFMAYVMNTDGVKKWFSNYEEIEEGITHWRKMPKNPVVETFEENRQKHWR